MNDFDDLETAVQELADLYLRRHGNGSLIFVISICGKSLIEASVLDLLHSDDLYGDIIFGSAIFCCVDEEVARFLRWHTCDGIGNFVIHETTVQAVRAENDAISV